MLDVTVAVIIMLTVLELVALMSIPVIKQTLFTVPVMLKEGEKVKTAVEAVVGKLAL